MESKKAEEKKMAENAMKGMRSFFFYMLADFAIIAGIVLALFGVGDFLSSLIGIAGSGKVALGILLLILGTVVLARTKARIQIGMQPQMPQQQEQPPPPPPPESGTYR
jgi:ABC-type anion transport system duplicated permease subunit